MSKSTGPYQFSTLTWQQEEARIYVRDIVFLLLIVVFSVFIAEQFLLAENPSLVDRIFSYLLIFIPLGTLNLIAHYYYRNRRIRITGSLRSSMRYRLSIAFMLVAVIPSIPIFLISSNMVEKLVEDFFQVDVARSLESARIVLDYYRQEEERLFYENLRSSAPELFERPRADRRTIQNLYANRVLVPGQDYAGLYDSSGMTYETTPFFEKRGLQSFTTSGAEGVARWATTFPGGDYLFYRLELEEEGRYLILGRRLHPGVENHYQDFYTIYSRFKDESRWREKVSSTLRLGLGLLYVFMICFALIMAIIIARQIALPIVSLAAATRSVTDGNLDTRLDIKARGEMGILIDSFNQMTAELKSLRRRLLHSQRLAAWREVARRLAHEIQNPLTPIQLSADRMLRRLDQPEKGKLERVVRRGAVTIVEQVDILKHMVREFVDFARLPAANPTLQSFTAIVAEAVDLHRSSKDIAIDVRTQGNVPEIYVDKNIIMGMITNLIKNAAESIRGGKGDGEDGEGEAVATSGDASGGNQERIGRLRVSTRPFRQMGRWYVEFKVEDSGPGVDEDLRDRIFEPYFSTKGEHGNGLGLSLVEKAVLEHDARIQVNQSRDLGGAEFRVLFPIPVEQRD